MMQRVQSQPLTMHDLAVPRFLQPDPMALSLPPESEGCLSWNLPGLPVPMGW